MFWEGLFVVHIGCVQSQLRISVNNAYKWMGSILYQHPGTDGEYPVSVLWADGEHIAITSDSHQCTVLILGSVFSSSVLCVLSSLLPLSIPKYRTASFISFLKLCRTQTANGKLPLETLTFQSLWTGEVISLNYIAGIFPLSFQCRIQCRFFFQPPHPSPHTFLSHLQTSSKFQYKKTPKLIS